MIPKSKKLKNDSKLPWTEQPPAMKKMGRLPVSASIGVLYINLQLYVVERC